MVGGEVDCVHTFLMVFLGDLEGAGTFNPPSHSSSIQKPPTIRVKLSVPKLSEKVPGPDLSFLLTCHHGFF